jgi:RHS repeat-associated protein
MPLAYDALDRVLERDYPDGGIEHFGYSARGLIAYTNQLGFITGYGYDQAGRKIAETNANLEITQFRYDPSGSLTNLIDGKNQSTVWVYDQFGRVTNKLDALNELLFLYKYDLNSRLTNRWTPAKGSTGYGYDPVGNLTNIVYPVSSNIVLHYDALNRLTNMVDGIGTTRYSYDSVGQLLSEDGPWTSDTVSYTYANRLRTGLSVQAPNASPWTQSYGYDAARRLDSLASAAGTFSYGYTGVVAGASGSLVRRLSLPNGAWITNTYDRVARLRLTALENAANPADPHHGGGGLDSWFYTYNAGNQRTFVVRTDASSVAYTYDEIGQLKTAKGRDDSGTHRLHEQFGYVYDAAGNLNWRTNNALLQEFKVNDLNELTNVVRTGTLTVAGTTTSAATNVIVSGTGLSSGAAGLYSDATWARPGATPANGDNTFTAIAKDAYDRSATNTINTFLPSTINFSFDLNGNMLTNGTRFFEYDDENQLIRITEPGAWKSEFAYDGKMRRRIRREYSWSVTLDTWHLTQEIRYIYDGNLVLQERDGNNLPTLSLTRGRDLSGTLDGTGGIGGLLARTDNRLFAIRDLQSHAYYHADGNGNISCLVNTNQQVVARYLYDPYGNIVSRSGSLADANLYRFSSKELHSASGLVHYLYRCYEPGLQRWLTRDPYEDYGLQEFFAAGSPLGNEPNLHLFVRNNPMSMVDSWGLKPTYRGCSRKQQEALTKALTESCKKAKECARCTPAGEAQTGVDAICDGNVTVNCVKDDFRLPGGTGCDKNCGMTQGGQIYMCDRSFNGLKGLCDPEVGCTLFHEALHVGGLPGNNKVPHPDDFGVFAACMGCPFKLNK